MINIIIYLLSVSFVILLMHVTYYDIIKELKQELFYCKKGILVRKHIINEKEKQIENLINNKIEICDIECKEER